METMFWLKALKVMLHGVPAADDSEGGVGGLDAMLAITLAGRPPVNRSAGTMRRPAAAGKAKHTENVYELGKPPKLLPTEDMPSLITYGDCKIYTSIKFSHFRVVPFKITKNDFKFPWGDDRKKAWADVLQYCKKQTIPKHWKRIPTKMRGGNRTQCGSIRL